MPPHRVPALKASEEPLLASPGAHARPVPVAPPLEQCGVPVPHAEVAPSVLSALAQLTPEVPLPALIAQSERARAASPPALLATAVPGVLLPAMPGE